MTTPAQPKLPTISFIILSATLFLGGLATLGAFLLLYFYYPNSSAGSPSHTGTAFVLAANGTIGCALSVFCALSAWRSFKQMPAARSFAVLTCMLAAAFTVWVLIFDALSGWSFGGILEVVIWGLLETMITIRLIRARSGQP